MSVWDFSILKTYQISPQLPADVLMFGIDTSMACGVVICILTEDFKSQFNNLNEIKKHFFFVCFEPFSECLRENR